MTRAAASGHDEAVQMMLNYHPPNQYDLRMALVYAIESGRTATAKILLTKFPSDEIGISMMDRAIQEGSGHQSILEMLVLTARKTSRGLMLPDGLCSIGRRLRETFKRWNFSWGGDST